MITNKPFKGTNDIIEGERQNVYVRKMEAGNVTCWKVTSLWARLVFLFTGRFYLAQNNKDFIDFNIYLKDPDE
jgi:hypothetical protein